MSVEYLCAISSLRLNKLIYFINKIFNKKKITKIKISLI